MKNAWLSQWGPTIICGIIVAVVLFFAIKRIIDNKRNGKPSCGGDCVGCAFSKSCNKQNKPDGEKDE